MSDATRHSRRISPGLRQKLFFLSGETCQRCGTTITFDQFHVAHLRAHSRGRPAIESNLEAWCADCNIKNGNRDVRDTRVTLRAWQEDALPIVLEALTMEKVATVMAAPGAGKTLFAGMTFVDGQNAGLWNRLLVLVPRLTLVKQWSGALLNDYHIALDTRDGARQSGQELNRMDGVCCTYQTLLWPNVREGHRGALQRSPTLVILDEVHHLGQSANNDIDSAAWSKAVRELVGDLRTKINVAGVLNLSGTLFRTSPNERISTVKYADELGPNGEARIRSIANYEIHADRLVREGLLRPPDLYRVGANVSMVNLKTAEITEGAIADLDEDASRAALRQLPWKDEWISTLVTETLNQLKSRHRDSNSPVKALIVAHRQEMARRFAEEVDRQMVAQNLQPLAECVVSADGADAYSRLEDFRKKRRVGVLCTVGMAGEGYDCPDIAVVTYATNVQTAQYIRQVVARGQRVTPWERNHHLLTAAVILPDVPDLVEDFTEILAPMVHDIEVPTTPAAPQPERRQCGESAPPFSQHDLVSVQDAALEVVSAVGTGGVFDVNPALQDLLMPILRDVNIPESLWTRFAVAINKIDEQRPFDQPLMPRRSSGAGAGSAVADRPAPVQRPLTPAEHHDLIRKKLTLASGWWVQMVSKKGGQPVAFFVTEIYREANINKLDHATPEQLKRAFSAAVARITRHCNQNNLALPKWARTTDDEQ